MGLAENRTSTKRIGIGESFSRLSAIEGAIFDALTHGNHTVEPLLRLLARRAVETRGGDR